MNPLQLKIYNIFQNLSKNLLKQQCSIKYILSNIFLTQCHYQNSDDYNHSQEIKRGESQNR